MNRILTVFIALVSTAFLLPLQSQAQCTTEWTNAAGGNWNDAGNWTAGVPGNADNACITLDATYTVTLDVSPTVNSLTFGATSGANTQTLVHGPSRTLTLNANSIIEHDGLYDWEAGTFTGGATLTIDGRMTLSTPSSKVLNLGTTLVISTSGTVTWSGGTFSIENASTVQNDGLFDMQSDNSFSTVGADNTFVNNSLSFVKSAGSGTSTISGGVSFENNGKVEAQTGTIKFDGSSTQTNATVTASLGAEVYFNAGTHTIVGTLSGSPAGSVFMDAGASLEADAPGGTLDFSGTGFDWRSGSIVGGTTLTNDGAMTLSTATSKVLNGGTTLINSASGTMTWTGGTFSIENISTVQNDGLFDMQSNNSLSTVGADNTFVNNSLSFVKSAGSGTSTISGGVSFENNGKVEAQTGTIKFDGSSTQTNATVTASALAAVYFNAGTHTIVGTLSGSPVGSVFMDTGATLSSTGPATIDFGGTGFDWRSGSIDGGTTLTNDGAMTLSTATSKVLNGGTTLINSASGTMTWTGGSFFIENASTVQNDGLFDMQSDNALSPSGLGNTFVNNSLSFVKSAGTGTSTISSALSFENNGKVEAQTGTIKFDGSSTQTNATVTASALAAVYFNAGTHTIVGTLSGSPAGSVFMDTGASLEADASGGTLDFSGTGFDWRSGTIEGGTTLTNDGTMTLSTIASKVLDEKMGVGGTTLINSASGTMTWTGGNFFIENASTVQNDGFFDMQGDNALSTVGADNTFVNTSLSFVKSAGSGTSTISGGVSFENNGKVEAQTGTIKFDGSSTQTDATVTASLGAEVYFNAGTHTIVGTLSGSPAGSVFMDTGASLEADASGGTLDFSGTGFDWRSGTIEGGTTLTNDGTMTLSTIASKVLDEKMGVGGTTLINSASGTMTWTGGNFFIENASTLQNAGLFDMQGDNSLSASGTGTKSVINALGGTFKKTIATGTSTIVSGVTFNNQSGGIVSAESGTMNFDGPFTNADGALVQGNATVDFLGASVTNDGAFGPGTSPGILTHLGPFDMSSATTALNIELGGTTPGDHDQLVVSNNTATLGGTLNVSLVNGFVPADGDTFVILTANSVSGKFTNPNVNDRIYIGNGLAFTVIYNASDVTLVADVLAADYALAKSVDQSVVDVGTNVTFTVTLTNNGPDDLTEFGADAAIEVTDLLPTGLTFVSATPSAGSYDSGTGVWNLTALAASASETLDIVATVSQAGMFTNTATRTASALEDPNATNDTASVGVEGQAADLAVTKTVDQSTVTVGENVVFTVTVTNNGPNDATGVVVTDLLPTGLTFVSASSTVMGSYDSGTGLWTVGNLANSATETLTLTATVDQVGVNTNTATRTAGSPIDLNSTNDSSDAGVTGQDVDVAVTKTADKTSAKIGDNVTFTVTATNNGPGNATGVVVTDLLPSGLTFVSASSTVMGSYNSGTGLWTVGNLPNSATETLTLTASVDQTGLITNTAAVTHVDQPDSNSANDSASAGVTGVALSADLALTKTVDLSSVTIGSNVVFTVTATNNGPDATTGVEVTDALPAGLAFVSASASHGSYVSGTGVWTVGGMANGASETLTITATVNQVGLNTNTASVTASDVNDPDNSNDSASASVTGNGLSADLAIDKAVDNPNANVGDNVVFTITLSNNGPNDATGIEATDVLPAGLTFVSSAVTLGSYNDGTGVWTVGTIANGGAETLTITATVAQAGSIMNTAAINHSDVADPDPGNNSDSVTVNGLQVDIALTKTVNAASVTIGSNVVFTLTATNNGPGEATGVAVTDVLPAGLAFVSASAGQGSYASGTGIWTVGTLANAGSATLMITATVNTVGLKTNTATVTAVDQPDSNSANDTASADVTGTALSADLAVTKTVDQSSVTVGTNVVFTVTVTNNGPNNTTGVVLTDALPAGLTFVSASSTVMGSYDSGTGLWTVGALANAASETLTLTATVDNAGANTNTAAVSATDVGDPNASNDSADASVTGTALSADLSLTKTVDQASVTVGASVVFTVTLTNGGPDDATGVVVADALPTGTTFVSFTASTGSYAGGLWTVGALANSASATLTLTASVDAVGDHTNTATISASDVADPDDTNNSASATVTGTASDPCSDPGTAPFWDGTVAVGAFGDGTGSIPLSTPTGLASIVLGVPSTNLALREIRDAGGTMDILTDFTGSDPITGTECSGFGRFDFTGTPGTEPTDVKLVVCAPEVASSFFFLEVSDTCPRTLRVDPDVSLYTATAIEEATRPTEFALEQNYPNPLSAQTTIRFSLPEARSVNLTVFDVLGRSVVTLIRGEKSIGNYQVHWDGRDASGALLPSGMYLYRIQAGSFVATRSLTLLR